MYVGLGRHDQVLSRQEGGRSVSMVAITVNIYKHSWNVVIDVEKNILNDSIQYCTFRDQHNLNSSGEEM